MGDLQTAAREALELQWAAIPVALQAHPGVKALYRTAIAAIAELDADSAQVLRALALVNEQRAEIDRLRAALDAGQAQPVAWMDAYGACIPDSMRARMLADGGASQRTAELYSVPLYAAPQASQPAGEVVVTKAGGRIVAVTRQDEEGRILSVIAEADEPQAAQPVAPAGWKLVPVEPTPEMVEHAERTLPGAFSIGDEYRAMLSAAPNAPAARPLTEEHDAALADLSMMLKTCAWALRRGSSPELGERALELLKRHGLLGSPLRSEALDEAGRLSGGERAHGIGAQP